MTTVQKSFHIRDKSLTPFHENFTQYYQSINDELNEKLSEFKKSHPQKTEYDFWFNLTQSQELKDFFYFEDHIEMKKIESVDELINYFKEAQTMGVFTSGSEDPKPFFDKLKEIVILIKTYQQQLITENIEDFELSPEGFKVQMDSINFNEKLKELKKENSYPEFINLYALLVKDENFLRSVTYSDESDIVQFNDRCDVKENDLQKFFNEITIFANLPAPLFSLSGLSQYGNYSNGFRTLGSDFADELLYKMILIATKLTDPTYKMSDVDKAFLTSNLIHAGRHCADAKNSAVNENLFPKFCQEKQAELVSELYSEKDFYSWAFYLNAQFKKASFEEWLNSYPDFKNHSEESVRKSTYDTYAMLVAVPSQRHAYDMGAIKMDIEGFFRFYNEKSLTKNYQKKCLDRLNKDQGPLRNFIKQEKFLPFLIHGELTRFGILSGRPKVSDEEKAVLNKYPQLKKLKGTINGDLETYNTLMVLHGILEGKQELVSKFLNKVHLDKEITFKSDYGPFPEKKISLLKFILTEWNGGETKLNDNLGLKDFVEFIKQSMDMTKKTHSPILISLKAGNEIMSRYLFSQGFELTSPDEEILKKSPSKTLIEMVEKIWGENKKELLIAMNEKLQSAPLLPEGFEVSFHTEFPDGKKLIWSKNLKEKLTWEDAINPEIGCKPPSRLPTKDEYKSLVKMMREGSSGGYNRNFFVDSPGYSRESGDDGKHASFAGSGFWSSERSGDNFAWHFNGTYGYDDGSNISVESSVRCVLDL